jgi:tetratricopeptide (TPR) repeat protein
MDPNKSRVISPERPWLGLKPFTEEFQRYFFGRDDEVVEIFGRARNNALTTLFGQSGLGKTSLLGAGLIPMLKVERFTPVLLHLRYNEKGPTVLEQVRGALAQACGVLPLAWEGNTLWHCLHRKEHRNGAMIERPPVLILDQFEEIFTLAGTPKLKAEVTELMHQLADVVENRPPEELQEKLVANRELMAQFDVAPSPLRLILTLREDFLSHLETWRRVMPSLMKNRFQLNALDGRNAVDAVARPGRLCGSELVSAAVAETIVRFVAKVDPVAPMEDIEAVPPLLSLFCDELNEARLAAGEASISAELVISRGEDILRNFYEQCFEVPGASEKERLALREYVEERMLTERGHRIPVDQEESIRSLEATGVKDPRRALAHLVDARLISTEEKGSTRRLEITHDLVAPLMEKGRAKRRVESESRRRRAYRLRFAALAGVSLLVVSVLSYSLWSVHEERDAAKAAKQDAENQKSKAVGALLESERQREAAELHRRTADKMHGFLNLILHEVTSPNSKVEMLSSVTERVSHIVEADADVKRDPLKRAQLMETLGDLFRAQQKPDFAKRQYEDADEFRGQNKPDETRWADWTRDRGFNLRRRGDLAFASKDYEGALELFEECLTTREELVKRTQATDAANADRNDLAWAKLKCGESLLALKRPEEAQNQFEDALKDFDELIEREPDNQLFQKDCSIALERIATLLSARGQNAKALERYKQCVEVRTTLVDKAQENLVWKRYLAVAHRATVGCIKDLARENNERANLEEVLSHLRKSKNLWDQIAESAKNDNDSRTAYIEALLLLAEELDSRHVNSGEAKALKRLAQQNLEAVRRNDPKYKGADYEKRIANLH